MELRVKTAIEAEAISQQRLAAAEAEIADLRRKWEASKRCIILPFDDIYLETYRDVLLLTKRVSDWQIFLWKT